MQETVNDVMSKKVVAVLPGDTLGTEGAGYRPGYCAPVRCGGKRALSGKGLSDYDQGCGQRFSRTYRQRGGPAHGKGADPAAAGA